MTGLADALIMCGARYGGARAVKFTRAWLKAVRDGAYRASAALAQEKGPFPLFDAEAYLAGETVRSLDPALREEIARHGIRNALLTSIAPTGTISLFADNVSSGIEPVFSYSYTRSVLMPNDKRREERVTDFAYRQFRRQFGEDAPLPDYFTDAQSLTPHDHIVMQAAAQDFIDSSISKTINCPAGLSFEAFKEVYLEAYESGCKGCTTYRPERGHGLGPARRHGAGRRRSGGRIGRARTGPDAAGGGKSGRRRLRRRSGRVYDAAARPAGGPARSDLQDQMGGFESRHIHHVE